MIVKQIVFVATVIVVSACGDSVDSTEEQAVAESSAVVAEEYVPPAPSTSYAEAHAAALEAIEISTSRGYAWSTSDALLAQGVAAAAEGNEKLAIEFADRARIQAELAIRQADFEEGAWSERVLSN